MSRLKEMSDLVKVQETFITKRMAEEAMLKAELTAKRLRMDEAAKAVTMLGDAVSITQKFSDGIQSGVVQRFEDLLTRGVREIFDKDYAIKIELTAKGNGVSAEFYAILPDGKKVSLSRGEGGGLKDLVGILQRVLYVILEPSHPAKLICLDEAGKYIDATRGPAAFSFIANLCKELGVQVIWITHADAIKNMDDAGIRVIRIGDSRGEGDVIQASE
jgi:hypothetical protein